MAYIQIIGTEETDMTNFKNEFPKLWDKSDTKLLVFVFAFCQVLFA